MKKVELHLYNDDTVVFDQYEYNSEVHDHFVVDVCQKHIDSHFKYSDYKYKRLNNINGLCCNVKGCKNKAKYYIIFQGHEAVRKDVYD